MVISLPSISQEVKLNTADHHPGLVAWTISASWSSPASFPIPVPSIPTPGSCPWSVSLTTSGGCTDHKSWREIYPWSTLWFSHLVGLVLDNLHCRQVVWLGQGQRVSLKADQEFSVVLLLTIWVQGTPLVVLVVILQLGILALVRIFILLIVILR